MNQGEVARAFDDIRTQFTNFISKYPFVVIIIVAIILVIVFVNRLTPVLRVQNAVSGIQGFINTGEIKTDIYPLNYWIKEKETGTYIDGGNTDHKPTPNQPFKKYQIMSSAKSYLVKNRHYDFCSLRVLQSILLLGAKFVELDVFNAGFGEDMSYPIVTNGKDTGEWKTCINKLSFEECCNTVLKYGIQYWEQNWTSADPVFLYLNCHSLSNDTQNKMAEIIYRVFSDKYLLPVKYCNAGKSGKSGKAANTNIMDEAPENFYNKIIIVTNSDLVARSPRFNEMVNLSEPDFKSWPYQKMPAILSPNNLSMVYDESAGNELVNYNPIVPWVKKANFVAMHFQSNDNNIKQYLKMFSLQYPQSEQNKKDKGERKTFIVNTSYRLMKT
jgi:hypothetical protein